MLSLYNIYCKGRKIHSEISEEEMLDILADFADEFHANGTPDPVDIDVELIEQNGKTRKLTNG